MTTPNTPNFMNTMNMGGGVASSGGKRVTTLVGKIRDDISQLVAGLKQATSEFLNMAQGAEKAANSAAKLKGTVLSTGFIQANGSGGFGRVMGGLGTIGIAGVTAANQAIDLDQFAENSMSRARIGFLSGQGPQAASAMAQRMMNRGTGIDQLDAQRAQLMGASMGLSPALQNYSAVAGSAETVSNLMPGVGLTGGMQASAALNQAQNVNRLRMIGIQVRDPATGLFRGVPQVINDIYSVLERSKTGGGRITKKDIAFALQPGNSLDMMIKQYFGNDPILAQAVAAGLLQKAGGGDLSRESLVESGALPALAASQGERYAKEFGVVEAYTGNAERGMMAANEILGQVADSFRDSVNLFGGAVEAFAGVKQLAGGAGGAIGTFGTGLISGGGQILGGVGQMLGTAGLAAMLMGKGGGGGGLFGGLFGRGGRGGAPVFDPKTNRYRNPSTGRFAPAPAANPRVRSPRAGALGTAFALPDLFAAIESGDPAAIGDLVGSLIGGFAGGFFGSAAGPAGTVAGGFVGSELGGGIGRFIGSSLFGEGDGDDDGAKAADSGRFNPLEELVVNASYLKKRDYLIDGKRPANPYHTGVDFDADIGDPVYAVKDGNVVPTQYSPNGFGNQVRIKHPDGYTTTYAHLSKKLVNGGTVKAGQLIGYAGNSGLSSGPHLHFEVWRGNNQSTHVDPMAYITGSPSPSGATAAPAASGYDDGSTKSLIGELSSGVELLPGLTGAASPRGEGGEAGGSLVKNYGGVTVNISVPKNATINEQTLAREIKRVLSEDEIMTRAVTR